MEQLIKHVTEKTGLNPDQARSAASAVIGFLKDKMPASIGGQIDNYVGGSTGGGNGLGDIGSKLGGMLGGNK